MRRPGLVLAQGMPDERCGREPHGRRRRGRCSAADHRVLMTQARS
jgi:hypothetical protein